MSRLPELIDPPFTCPIYPDGINTGRYSARNIEWITVSINASVSTLVRSIDDILTKKPGKRSSVDQSFPWLPASGDISEWPVWTLGLYLLSRTFQSSAMNHKDSVTMPGEVFPGTKARSIDGWEAGWSISEVQLTALLPIIEAISGWWYRSHGLTISEKHALRIR